MPATLDHPSARPAEWTAAEWDALVAALTRRKLLGGGLALGLLTACGGGSPPTATAPATRAYTDDEGRVIDLPQRPQRVVVLDPNRTIALLVDLGLVPIGATTNGVNPGGRLAPTLGAAGEQIQPVGRVGQADIERIAQIRPDLILLNTGYGQVGLDQLAAIAPTVAFKGRPTLVEELRRFGELVGRAPDAERRIAEMDALLGRLAATGTLRDKAVAVPLLYTAQPTFNVYGPKSGVGDVLTKLGLRLRPEMVDGAPLENFVGNLSLERIGPLLSEETIILLRYYNADGADANIAAVTGSPVWQSLPAVRRGRVVTLDIQEITGSYGVRGIELAAERLARDFAALPA